MRSISCFTALETMSVHTYILRFEPGKFYYSTEAGVCIKATSPDEGIKFNGQKANWTFDQLAEKWRIERWYENRMEYLKLNISVLERDKLEALEQLRVAKAEYSLLNND